MDTHTQVVGVDFLTVIWKYINQSLQMLVYCDLLPEVNPNEMIGHTQMLISLLFVMEGLEII
jgi:hypothetical protein